MTTRFAAGLAALAVLVAGCSGGARTGEPSSPSTSPSSASSSSGSAASPTAPPTATPAAVPRDRACYEVRYQQAIAPTTGRHPVACARRHTAMTFAVGALDTVVAGHSLAVDSDRVQAQPARACPTRLAAFLGGSEDDRRLSMLRAVWFTPTVEQSDAGASWYRCDVVALAGDQELAPLTGRLAGVLDDPGTAARYAMCGTAEPGTADFDRVICSRDHSWRAISVVALADGPYPGEERVRAAGQGPCQDAGASVADDSLDYQWGYEWPTAEQWADGQHFGRCWAPD